MRQERRTTAWILAATLCTLPIGSAALAEVPAGPPRVSPMSSVSQIVGVSEIAVIYSRPSVNQRQIWGDLVPWGEVWRTGANEATTITFSHDAEIDGHAVPAGSYGLFTIPGEEEWTVVFNKVADQWGAFQYNEAEDALRIKVKPRSAPHQERFQVTFPEVGVDSAVVSLEWEEVAVPFDVQFDVHGAAVEAAREFVASAPPAEGRMIWNWANYCYQSGVNTEEALTWASNLAQAAPMYWTYALEARLLAKNERAEEAIASAEKALERAKEESEQPGVAPDSETLAGELEAWRAGSE